MILQPLEKWLKRRKFLVCGFSILLHQMCHQLLLSSHILRFSTTRWTKCRLGAANLARLWHWLVTKEAVDHGLTGSVTSNLLGSARSTKHSSWRCQGKFALSA